MAAEGAAEIQIGRMRVVMAARVRARPVAPSCTVRGSQPPRTHRSAQPHPASQLPPCRPPSSQPHISTPLCTDRRSIEFASSSQCGFACHVLAATPLPRQNFQVRARHDSTFCSRAGPRYEPDAPATRRHSYRSSCPSSNKRLPVSCPKQVRHAAPGRARPRARPRSEALVDAARARERPTWQRRRKQPGLRTC